MKTASLFLLLGIVFFATGCPNQPSKSFKDEGTLVSNVNDYLREQQLRFNCARDEGKKYVPTEIRFEGKSRRRVVVGGRCEGSLEAPLDAARRVRNDALEDAISVIDSNYNDYITNLDQRRSKTDFLLDVIDLGASAATGIAKGERPNQILGIGITAFRGGRRSIELNFYKQQTVPILITKMDDNRAKVYASILQKRDRSADEYTMKAALRDIVEYYNAGTLIRAFAELGKDAAAQARDSEKAVRILRGDIEITDIPTEAESATTNAIFRQGRSLENQLKAAQAQAAAAADAIAVPTPLPATAPDADRQANAAAIKAAEEKRAAARTTALKPMRDKLVAIWTQITAQNSLAAAVTQLRGDDLYKDIFVKLDANQPLTEDEYLDLIVGIAPAIRGNPTARRDYLAILNNNR